MVGPQNQVAVLSTGAMGHEMATRALRAGFHTIVWNREPAATRALAQLGAEVAETPADAAARATIVVTMVTDANALISIARDQGMLAALAPGAIWVQMSTIGVAGIELVAALASEERPDITLLDAPVSGSNDPADQGQLTIFASGPDEARARVTPLFDALGQRTIWVGPVGTGTRVKVVDNTWFAFGAEAVAASVSLALRLGVDTDTVVDALAGGPLVSPWQAAKLRRIVEGDFSSQFGLSLALKDVRLALDAAADNPSTVLRSLAAEWQRVVDLGLGNEDVTVVTRALELQGAALATVRSHDQFNTTIYSNDDRYRGLKGLRTVVFMNENDMRDRGLEEFALVDITSFSRDGTARNVHGYRAVRYEVPPGCAAGYMPELNVLCGIADVSTQSEQPVTKHLVVEVKPSGATESYAPA